MPMLELIEQTEMAVDGLIDVAGRVTIAAVLTLSTRELAGLKHPGKAGGDSGWHGRQGSVVSPSLYYLVVRLGRLRSLKSVDGNRRV